MRVPVVLQVLSGGQHGRDKKHFEVDVGKEALNDYE
jgi:hypothetical protein